MNEEKCIKIEILKEIPFFGQGDCLEKRLKKVVLKGFPEVNIYENSSFELLNLRPNEIKEKLHTPQPRVYKEILTRINLLYYLFLEQGIDITHLEKAFDFIATSESGEETEWTMIPPIIEKIHIPKTKEGKLDYESIIGPKLRQELKRKGLNLNSEALLLKHTSNSEYFDLINDGSHRIHYGFENNGIKILRIIGANPDFPYYAAPQKYDIQIFETREEALKLPETKIHILESPAHKSLYRLFPSGGIKSGDVRLVK